MSTSSAQNEFCCNTTCTTFPLAHLIIMLPWIIPIFVTNFQLLDSTWIYMYLYTLLLWTVLSLPFLQMIVDWKWSLQSVQLAFSHQYKFACLPPIKLGRQLPVWWILLSNRNLKTLSSSRIWYDLSITFIVRGLLERIWIVWNQFNGRLVAGIEAGWQPTAKFASNFLTGEALNLNWVNLY